MAVEIFNLIFKRRNFAGSLIGGIKETQEMLDFCAVEIIPIQKINEAYERMLRSDVEYRFSIDMGSAIARGIKPWSAPSCVERRGGFCDLLYAASAIDFTTSSI